VLEDDARSIFLKALVRGPDEWPTFLDEACAADAGLRARVDQLLEAHREMGHIGDADANATRPSDVVRLTETSGTTIGPYRLLEQIGEGGFGVVYMAEQTAPVRRKVALKVIKPGMDSRRVVARFEAERQALALMDHPNIAQVFDGGATATGRPYFVMELVRGVPITEFCDQRLLTVGRRIELFVTVCHAVQHAHQKGIIHRDLKPSNVMVAVHDDNHVVKVIDFGIAKAVGQQLTEKTLFTNFAQIIGTPPYMSPEQAELSGLDVDTRTDIYALGVLLYELLTGVTPFDQARLRTVAFDEIRRIIREEEPPRPSTRVNSDDDATTTVSAKRGSDPRQLSRTLRGELDWIVMKCLEKDRNRRYETASGLAIDLLRYLNGEPVQACPPSPAYRLHVFVRRHKATLGMAGLLLTIALAGGALTVWQAVRAASERDAAVSARLALSAARQSAAEERLGTIAGVLETFNKANSLIESGRSHADFGEWAKAEAELTEASALRPDHSSVWLTRGEVYARLGLWDLAAADFLRAWQLQAPASVKSLYLHALLRCTARDWAGYRDVCGRMVRGFNDSGVPRAWEEEAARTYLLGEAPDLGPDRLVALAQRAVYVGRSAVRLATLGTALYRAGQYEKALRPLREAKDADPAGATTWADSVTAMTHHRLGQPEPARKALGSAGDSLARRFRLRSVTPGTAPNAQWWYEAQGELYFREATRLIEGAEPEAYALYWSNRGDSLVALGRYHEAIESFGRAIELSPEPHDALRRRADTYLRVGDWGEVLRDFERLRSLKPDDASLNDELAWRLGTCPDPKYRDCARAARLAHKAVGLAPEDGKAWNTLGVVLYRAGDWPGSAKAALKSMELTNAVDVRAWLVLAMCQWQLGEKERARQLLQQAARWAPVSEDRLDHLAELREEAGALIGRPEASPTVPLAESPEEPVAYTLVLETEPGAGWAYALRGEACARLKQWDQAAADYMHATRAHPDYAWWWYCQAAARIGAGDAEGYRRTRSGMLGQFRKTGNPGEASNLCYISVVMPFQPEEADDLLRLAELAVSARPENPRVRGAINYRAGRYEATIADLTRSAIVYHRRAWDWLFLAMAHHKLGHADEARKALKEADEWVERANRPGTTWPGLWLRWSETNEVARILLEAKDMIR
jgi:serine/threonine protein kinase/Flp pilus assembly protein TadD